MEGEGRRWPALLQSRPTASNIFRLIRNANMGALPPACSHPRRHLLAPKSLPPAKVFGRALPSLLFASVNLVKSAKQTGARRTAFCSFFPLCFRFVHIPHTALPQMKTKKAGNEIRIAQRKREKKSKNRKVVIYFRKASCKQRSFFVFVLHRQLVRQRHSVGLLQLPPCTWRFMHERIGTTPGLTPVG